MPSLAPHKPDRKVALAWALMERRKQRCREDLYTFAATVAMNQEGKPLDMSWEAHRVWYRHLDYCWSNNLRCLLVAPMNHGKSAALCIPLAAWWVGKYPESRIKIVCSSDAMSVERVAAIRTLMETQGYKDVFPSIRPGKKWAAHEIYVHRKGVSIDPTIHARGVDTRGAGSRADLIIYDDVCDQNNSTEEAQRKKVLERVNVTWMTRLEANSPMVLWVGTPYHGDDATHHFMDNPGWGTLIQRARGLEKECNAHDLELRLNPTPGHVLPPYPAPPLWEPGQPLPPAGEVRWIQP